VKISQKKTKKKKRFASVRSQKKNKKKKRFASVRSAQNFCLWQ